jgi:hypothetical protein
MHISLRQPALIHNRPRKQQRDSFSACIQQTPPSFITRPRKLISQRYFAPSCCTISSDFATC